MKRKILIVIDMQNDFVDGVLGTKEAQAIVKKVLDKVKNFSGEIIFTQDTHKADYLETQEGKNLPVEHCIKGSYGWQLIDSLKEIIKEKGCRVFEKNTFGSTELAQTLKNENKTGNPIDEIQLIGLCTDICVVSNAMLLKAFMPEVSITVEASCCAGVTVKKHEAALDTLSSCQIKIL